MNKRWSALGIILGVMSGLIGAAYYWLVRRPLPQAQGVMRVPSLQAPVEIMRDRWGIPHIYAHNLRDLMFAQGFVHAQDRLWQMDWQRRLVAGRLSEIVGAATVPLDRWIRALGMRRVAEQEVALIDGEILANLHAYTAGVNRRIALGRLPIEFTLLRYEPEPWTVADTLSWVKMMSWGLSVNWEAELLRAQLIAHLGPDQAAELEPDYPANRPYAVPPGVDYSALGQAALERAQASRPFTGPPARDGLGSNNWVLAGWRTASGKPLLANDMHLSINTPSIWYENHLCSTNPRLAEQLNVTGITLPGIPGVISGHNEHVAWGFTNGFADVQDLYIEHLRHTDEGRVQYEFKGEWLDAQVTRQEIGVRGSPPVFEDVVVTHHGPIINAMLQNAPAQQPLALRWTSLEPDTMICALYAMNRARDCIEFRQALRHWMAPIQNTVYADTQGNIGYSFPGKLPIRAKGQGRVPVPGWTGEYEWTGYVPFEELPHLYNPPQGYIATANNRVTDDNYPYFIGHDHCTSDRAQRIIELIEARPKIDLAYIQRMQFDLVLPAARIVAGYLRQLKTDDPELAAVVKLMQDWNGELAADNPAAAVYELFVQRSIHLMLADKLGQLTARYMGQGPTPVLHEGSIFGERAVEWLLQILAEPNSHWFDLGHGETRDDILRLALRETLDILQARLGPKPSDWAWGKLHTLSYIHPLGNVKPLDKLFNRGPYPVGGDANTVCAAGFGHRDLSGSENVGAKGLVGAPFRFIADLGDLRNSWGLLAPGQSGQPGSKHYDDQAQAWFEGHYHPMLFARDDIERAAKAVLWLKPQQNKF